MRPSAPSRRGEAKRTEHGPAFESPNPGAGCNSTHVARARKKWKLYRARSERRAGGAPKFHGGAKPQPQPQETP